MSLDDEARIHLVVAVVGAVCGVLTRSTVALPSSRTTAASAFSTG
jgi:hypothetical protein